MEQVSGKYHVIYKHPNTGGHRANNGRIEIKTYCFEGECENFTPVGKCVFRNKKNELLLVEYLDIVQMRAVNDGS